jgi:hypothetical protein
MHVLYLQSKSWKKRGFFSLQIATKKSEQEDNDDEEKKVNKKEEMSINKLMSYLWKRETKQHQKEIEHEITINKQKKILIFV